MKRASPKRLDPYRQPYPKRGSFAPPSHEVLEAVRAERTNSNGGYHDNDTRGPIGRASIRGAAMIYTWR